MISIVCIIDRYISLQAVDRECNCLRYKNNRLCRSSVCRIDTPLTTHCTNSSYANDRVIIRNKCCEVTINVKYYLGGHIYCTASARHSILTRPRGDGRERRWFYKASPRTVSNAPAVTVKKPFHNSINRKKAFDGLANQRQAWIPSSVESEEER